MNRSKKVPETLEEVEKTTRTNAPETSPDSGSGHGTGRNAVEESVPRRDADMDSDRVELTSLEERIEALTEEKKKLQDQLLRTAAEFENYKKRRAAEFNRLAESAAEGLILDLIPILDDLDLLISNSGSSADNSVVIDGARMIRQKLFETLQRRGFERIEAEGQPFDPEIHEALMQQPSEEVESDTVIAVHQQGYRLKDRLLRPSRVIVSTEPDVKEEE